MSDIFNQFKFRLKLIFSDKNICILFVAVILFSFLITGTLTESTEKRSNIPVGIIDLDKSIMSKRIVENFTKNPAIYVYIGSAEELEKKLNEQLIEVIFTIEKGFEKNIKNGDIKKLINVRYLKNDKANTILTDIFAGEMMYDLCIYKTYNEYESLNTDKELISMEEFLSYAKSLYNSDEYKFKFDLEVVNLNSNKPITDSMDNSLIYKQIVISIISILISFVIMFAVNSIVLEKELEINKRSKISLIGKTNRSIGNYFAVLCVGIILSIIYFSIILKGGSLKSLDAVIQILGVFISFSIVMSLLFCLICHFTNTMIKFQFIGSGVVITMGVIGFLVQVLDKFNVEFLKILKLLPNCWFIKVFTDIIINM